MESKFVKFSYRRLLDTEYSDGLMRTFPWPRYRPTVHWCRILGSRFPGRRRYPGVYFLFFFMERSLTKFTGLDL